MQNVVGCSSRNNGVSHSAERCFHSGIDHGCLDKERFTDRNALRKAVQNFRLLPENAIVHVQGQPLDGIVPDTNTEIYEMLPTGDFILENKAAEEE